VVSAPSLPARLRPRPPSSSALVPPLPSRVITILRLCCVHRHRRHRRHRQVPAPAAAEAPTRLAIGLEYQGCLHRATGLHHCLRRSANHPPPSPPPPLPPAAASLCHTRPPFASPPAPFVLRQPSAFVSSSCPPEGRLRREYEYHTSPSDSPSRPALAGYLGKRATSGTSGELGG